MLFVASKQARENCDRMTLIDDTTRLPLPGPSGEDALADLDDFRAGLYRCVVRRGETLFELADAVACATSQVTDLARLSLHSEHRRGHGGLYDGLNAGRLRRVIMGTRLPRMAGPGSCWPWMCPTGCARMRPPARIGRS